MTEVKGTYALRGNGHKSEAQEVPHEHLFRLAIGSPIIRWCERCGASYLLQQREAVEGEPLTYIWVPIEESVPNA